MKKVTHAQIIKLMESDKYKDRFKAEYYQLVERREKLIEMLEQATNGTAEVSSELTTLLEHQRKAMTYYMHTLEKRAEIEKIKL